MPRFLADTAAGETIGRTGVLANVEMAAAWDGEEGGSWARDWSSYDRSISSYQEVLAAAATITGGERVLDIGCGNGESSRAAARAAFPGSVVGVDLSKAMLERACDLSAAEGLTNVTFEQADAQIHPFEPGAYDVVISRFGAMFFSDRVAAFRNIHRATRDGGRLVMLAWQGLTRNEWMSEIRAALAAGRDLPSPPPGEAGPFGLADPDGVQVTLEAAGYQHVAISSVEEPIFAGTEAEEAYRFFCGTGMVRGLVAELDARGRDRALSSLRAMFEAHATDQGVQLGSAAWLITALRPSPTDTQGCHRRYRPTGPAFQVTG